MTRGPSVAWAEVTIDCHDPEPVARFWGALLDRAVFGPHDGWFRIESLVPGGPLINFQPVPEAKIAKNRVHLDLWVDPDELDAAVAHATRLGATELERQHSADAFGVIMADVEGNEFCIVAPA